MFTHMNYDFSYAPILLEFQYMLLTPSRYPVQREVRNSTEIILPLFLVFSP
jgi:hypothetical protein